MLGNTGLEMMPFLRNITFAGVNLEHLARHSTPTLARLTEKVFELLHAGHIGPVKPVTVYSISEMEKVCCWALSSFSTKHKSNVNPSRLSV
jgi:hypothetical protein